MLRRGRGLTVVAVLAGVLVLPSFAAAADFPWTGASASPNWSDGANWVGGTAPSGSVGILSFPALPGPCTTTCYQSTNDIAGLTANQISIDDGAPYQIGGSGLTLGAGGITAAPSAGDNSSANIGLPITLGASQTWSIAGGLAGELAVGGPVTGSGAVTLGVTFSSSGILAVSNVEVGTVNITGAGTAAVFGSLNGTDGNAVNLTGPASLAALAAGATSGPLHSTGGGVQVGAGHPLDGTLDTTGVFFLNSTSSLSMFIDQAGTTPSTDYSQVVAHGTVNLGGASLFLHGPGAGCPALHVGDVYTLVTSPSPGSFSGTFNGVPDGKQLTLICSGGTAPKVRINYTTQSVTATVVSSAPGGTTTALAASPSSAVTNQTVTLTATVGPNSPAPAGTVAFFDSGGAPISGCATQPVAFDGSTYTATCPTSFAAASSPHSLTATFTPTSSSEHASTSSVASLVVNQDSTTTALAVSSATPAVGDVVTYAASVTPAHSGPVPPSGSVQFLDNGIQIPECVSQQALIGGLASCTLTYSSPGPHSITAAYSGDGNFTVSTSSPPQTVTVQPQPPVNTAAPSISGNLTQGQTLTETNGTWVPTPTGFSYQWLDCDSAGIHCTAIPGATSQTYTLTASDVGHTIRVQELAANGPVAGSPATSAATDVVQPPSPPPTAPVSSSPPVITGTTTVGRTLSTSNGQWSGTPPSAYSYQWQRCSSTGCVNIDGETGSIYTLASADLGMKIRVVVVAVNNVGYGVAASDRVGPVVGTAQIRASLGKQLTPKGTRAKIGAIYKARGYEVSFKALEAGRVVIDWYLVPPGAHLARARPVLVATGRGTFTSAGTKQIKIKLTAAGRKLFKSATRLKLTAKSTFSAAGQAPIVARKTFTIRR